MTTQPESPEPLKVPEELLSIQRAMESGPTPGPWHSYTLGGQSPADFTLGGHLLELPKVYQDRSTALRPEDARYIASVNPAAMQAVLDYIAELQAAIQAARNEAEAMRAAIDAHNAECESMCEQRQQSGDAHCPFAKYGRQCPDCPRDGMLDIAMKGDAHA